MNFLKDILRGVLIGIANAIPGVSGGTMMVSMGIYDKIISAITTISKQLKKSIITLLPYGVGMVLGIVGLSFVIEYLFDHFPLQTALLFIGLILGGIPMLLGHFKGKVISGTNIIVFLLFFVFMIFLQWLGEGNGEEAVLTLSFISLLQLFFIGVVASATMVIPGVSGSMMLMLLGYYNPIIEMITAIIRALVSGDFSTLLTKVAIMIPFGIGVILGIYFIAKLIELLLKKKETLAYSGILGLVAASPFVVLMQCGVKELNVMILLSSAVTFCIGFVISFFLGRE
ncbi:DUF368 domain-containing protein [Anaeromicropila populeti]|uniref:Putative membrane protein n=1 Tax=Anaeromicropila populeti TaxID=37658 RepID=A0A1I6HKL0_9FIRM|nr:DUF368 domain-containing protein [Anaeromicropila populeti]SFR54830.1 putative membrane protein [Anaeromicropila populeti]